MNTIHSIREHLISHTSRGGKNSEFINEDDHVTLPNDHVTLPKDHVTLPKDINKNTTLSAHE